MRDAAAAEYIRNHGPPAVVNAVAIRLAKRCRAVFDGLLREEEFRDAEEALYAVIKPELEAIERCATSARSCGSPGDTAG